MSFVLGSWGMNRSAEQTNRPRTASRFTRFVCPVLRFIPHEPRKKDTHSLIDFGNRTLVQGNITSCGHEQQWCEINLLQINTEEVSLFLQYKSRKGTRRVTKIRIRTVANPEVHKIPGRYQVPMRVSAS